MNPTTSAWRTSWFATVLLVALLGWTPARAVPAFARQTGQNCVACHAGGQFPELTAYGRQFKLSGYTLGTAKTLPLAFMAVMGYTKNSNTTAGGADPKTGPYFGQDSRITLQSASLFLAGRITNNVGVFSQWTYEPYTDNGNGGYVNHSHIDQTELRVAQRYNSPANDWIFGAFVNNTPSMQDVWNSTPAWGYPYVASAFIPGPTPATMISNLAQGAVGTGAYVDWNQTIYAELSMYDSARGPFDFLRSGDLGYRFSKPAPYWRLTWSHNWGPSNLMVGTFGMVSTVHNAPLDTTTSTNRFRDVGFDSQYQYILDPNVFTAHFSYIREKQSWGPDALAGTASGQPQPSNASDTYTQWQIKGGYTYQAKYGGSLAYIRGYGTPDAGLYGPTGDPFGSSATNSPNFSAWIPEVFWMPIQNVRVGLQYWHFDKFNGGGSNYSGTGRDASNNDSVFLYVWTAL